MQRRRIQVRSRQENAIATRDRDLIGEHVTPPFLVSRNLLVGPQAIPLGSHLAKM